MFIVKQILYIIKQSIKRGIMEILDKKPSILQSIRASWTNLKHCNRVRLAYITDFKKDCKLIKNNLNKISKTYNLSYFSILYNSLVKYPFIGFAPSEFFMYEFFKNSHRDYLTYMDIISMVRINKWDYVSVGNKLTFKLQIKDKLPTANLIASYDHETGKITHYNKPSGNKVVIKTTRGGGGRGVSIVKVDDYEEIISNYQAECIVEDFIEQHDFLNNIFDDALNTVRILTLIDGDKPEAIIAVLKLGRSSTNHMDHFQNGGISVEIDMKTGLLLKGKSNFKFFEDGEYTSHPETGYEFYKKPLPFFDEVKKVAIEAHELFPSLKLIGWDIAITNKGPSVIEANRMPDFLMLQIFKPLRSKLARTLKI